MSSVSSLARARPPLRRPRVRIIVGSVALAVSAAAFLAVAAALDDQPRVDVVLENTTPHALEVTVRGVGEEGRLRLGRVESGATRTITGVLDQGERWEVDVRRPGVGATASTVVDRADAGATPLRLPTTPDPGASGGAP